MATYLLDSSVIIDFLTGRRGRQKLLEGLVQQGNMLACCSVNVAEVYAGLRPAEEARTEWFLRQLEYRETTWEIARDAGLLKNQWARKGRTLSLADATVAATALAHRLILMTDNVRHFPMPDLEMYPLRD